MIQMSLSNNEVAHLLRLVQATRDEELSCDDCLDSIADLAESELKGTPAGDQFDAVRQHLRVCEECQEEYEVLKRVLGDEVGGPEG